MRTLLVVLAMSLASGLSAVDEDDIQAWLQLQDQYQRERQLIQLVAAVNTDKLEVGPDLLSQLVSAEDEGQLQLLAALLEHTSEANLKTFVSNSQEALSSHLAPSRSGPAQLRLASNAAFVRESVRHLGSAASTEAAVVCLEGLIDVSTAAERAINAMEPQELIDAVEACCRIGGIGALRLGLILSIHLHEAPAQDFARVHSVLLDKLSSHDRSGQIVLDALWDNGWRLGTMRANSAHLQAQMRMLDACQDGDLTAFRKQVLQSVLQQTRLVTGDALAAEAEKLTSDSATDILVNAHWLREDALDLVDLDVLVTSAIQDPHLRPRGAARILRSLLNAGLSVSAACQRTVFPQLVAHFPMLPGEVWSLFPAMRPEVAAMRAKALAAPELPQAHMVNCLWSIPALPAETPDDIALLSIGLKQANRIQREAILVCLDYVTKHRQRLAADQESSAILAEALRDIRPGLQGQTARRADQLDELLTEILNPQS